MILLQLLSFFQGYEDAGHLKHLHESVEDTKGIPSIVSKVNICCFESTWMSL